MKRFKCEAGKFREIYSSYVQVAVRKNEGNAGVGLFTKSSRIWLKNTRGNAHLLSIKRLLPVIKGVRERKEYEWKICQDYH